MTKTETVTQPAAVGTPLECGVRPRAWMAMRYGVPAQATTDEPTALRWSKAGGDVRPLFEIPQDLADMMLRQLRHERALLVGFTKLGNEIHRAKRLDEWIAALVA